MQTNDKLLNRMKASQRTPTTKSTSTKLRASPKPQTTKRRKSASNLLEKIKIYETLNKKNKETLNIKDKEEENTNLTRWTPSSSEPPEAREAKEPSSSRKDAQGIRPPQEQAEVKFDG